jgi:hypothetical protein
LTFCKISATLLALYAHAFADTPAPFRDFKVVSGNYIFVMLAPDAPDEWARRDPALREVYAQSGLYRADGSRTPLWTVAWYAFEVFPSSDGEHLVRMWPWASSTDDPAVFFYKRGKEVKTYRIKDLVRDDSQLVRSVSFLHWRGALTYNDRDAVLFLMTLDNRVYRFSVRTGEILP